MCVFWYFCHTMTRVSNNAASSVLPAVHNPLFLCADSSGFGGVMDKRQGLVIPSFCAEPFVWSLACMNEHRGGYADSKNTGICWVPFNLLVHGQYASTTLPQVSVIPMGFAGTLLVNGSPCTNMSILHVFDGIVVMLRKLMSSANG